MLMWYQCTTVVKVALRKESVDRNTLQNFIDPLKNVALRKESVDRNFPLSPLLLLLCPSLSARRAWIEIYGGADCSEYLRVALRKESVDRNKKMQPDITARRRRSPQGERG